MLSDLNTSLRGIENSERIYASRKAFQRHAVILKKAAQGKGKGAQHAAQPISPFPARAQAEIYAHCHGDRQQSEQQLPQGQPEE